jgi:hypothetical protein
MPPPPRPDEQAWKEALAMVVGRIAFGRGTAAAIGLLFLSLAACDRNPRRAVASEQDNGAAENLPIRNF